MQIHRCLQQGLMLSFPADRRKDRGFGPVAPGKTILNRAYQRRLRTDFEPDIDSRLGQRGYRGSKLNRLSNSARPMCSAAFETGTFVTRNRTKERYRLRFRSEI